VDEEELHREHPVDERPEQRVREDPRVEGYFRVTVRVADPPRLLLTVTLPGFEDQLNSPR
jgi:hypothetical protein